MNESALVEVVQALRLAAFQRDENRCFRLAGRAPDWLPLLWPQAIGADGELRPESSPLLENFFTDAEACWQTGGDCRISSGPWVEKDAHGTEYRLQASALTAAGRATLVIEEFGSAYEERTSVSQKAHEAELAQASIALQEEVATRRNYAERLEGIYELDKAILAAQSPEAIAEAALRRLHHLLPCDQASVVELDPDHGRATVLAALHRGQTARAGGWQLSIEQLREARVLESGKPHRVTGTPNLFEGPDDGGATGARIWPLILDLPLIADETLIGVLNLATESPAEFSPEREEIALEVAAQLAVVLRQARLFAQVSAGREQLRALSLRLVEVQEAERRFIARELHDEIGQALTGLKLTLEMSRRQAVKAPDSGLWEALHMLDELMQRVRQLSLDLRPQMLDDLGLLPALDWLFQRYSKQTGIRVQFRHKPLHERLPTQLETAAFRIVQEALTNVARHADVAEATVRLWSDGHRLGVQVEDEGAGFDAARVLVARASTGLSGMKERAKLLGGEFTLDSSPGAGTRLTVEIPLDAIHATPASPSETTP